MKGNVTLSIDVEVLKKAKKEVDNLSGTVETFLRKSLGMPKKG